ncbi:MAG: nuclear transport factor 2 family protein [Pseudomonadota bacterium]
MSTTVKLCCALLLVHLSAHGAPPAVSAVETQVQVQLDAYNARDMEAFLATYADDAELFQFPGVSQTKGKAEMRKRYTSRFADTILHAQIVKRIVMGNTVIDHERVRVTLPEGPGVMEAIAIYELREGKIAKVTFIGGKKTRARNSDGVRSLWGDAIMQLFGCFFGKIDHN